MRFDLIYGKACEFLLSSGIVSLPVNPFELIARNHWGLVTYSELCGLVPESACVDDIAEACRSRDGFTVESGGSFCIAYNETVKVKSRVAFTLMHEVGHIVCGHFNGQTIESGKYRKFEREANFFASNVLAPAAVVNACNLQTPQILQAACGISSSAAKARLRELESWRKHPVDTEILKAFNCYIQISTRRSAADIDLWCAI